MTREEDIKNAVEVLRKGGVILLSDGYSLGHWL